jgi:hypothetical protein
MYLVLFVFHAPDGVFHAPDGSFLAVFIAIFMQLHDFRSFSVIFGLDPAEPQPCRASTLQSLNPAEPQTCRVEAPPGQPSFT